MHGFVAFEESFVSSSHRTGFAQSLKDASAADWQACVQHRFVHEIFAGTLDDAVLRRYLVQDYQFINRFVALLGAAIASADVFAPRVTLAQFATAWVLAHRAISSVIAGPRTLSQWTDYFPALDYALTAEDEALVNSLVTPGHPSTPGFNDPAYPLHARLRG